MTLAHADDRDPQRLPAAGPISTSPRPVEGCPHPSVGMCAAVAETFSELVNNAAEHSASPDGADVHVRFMPHRKGNAFDVVVADQGPGIRATLAANPALPHPETDAEAIGLAVQELVSGTGVPTRGIGLWMTVTEMSKPGRQLRVQSGSGLLTMYGAAPPELRKTVYHQGTIVRLTIPT